LEGKNYVKRIERRTVIPTKITIEG
jgi:3-oxoacid CoA-transferase subunit A